MVAAISLNPTNGNVGDTTVVTGTGFTAADAITFTFGGVAITPSDAPITADGSGNFTAHIVIPAGSAQSVQGAHAIVATDAHAGSDTQNYTINPKLVVSPTHGVTGATVTVTLSGYAATSALTATIHGTTVTLASSTTTANGDKSTTFTVPTSGVVDGANTISIHDAIPNTATASFELYLSSSGVSINSTFTHLNGRNLHLKNNTPCREREAIVDIAFDSTDTYETGGMTANFSVVEGFRQVYICDIAHKTYGLAVEFIPDASNSASLGKLKFYDSSGVELSSGSTAIQSQTLRCRIRGI